MARISNIHLMEQPTTTVVYMRATIDFMKSFADFAGASYDAIIKRLEECGRLPGGPPYACFHNADLENLDVEVGFPAAAALGEKGDIRVRTIPPLKIVSAIDQGPYEEQDPTLMDLFAWITEHGHQPTGEIYYRYLNEPEHPPEEYLTLMEVVVH